MDEDWLVAGAPAYIDHMQRALNYYDKKDSHEAELKLIKNQVVWESNPSGDDPTFTQGSAQAHETAEPVTAEQCAAFVNEIYTLIAKLDAAGDDIVALNQKVAGLAKALEESVPAKSSAEADWGPVHAPLRTMPFHIWTTPELRFNMADVVAVRETMERGQIMKSLTVDIGSRSYCIREEYVSQFSAHWHQYQQWRHIVRSNRDE